MKKKRIKLLGAGFLLMTCLATIAFFGNRNGKFLFVGNVESLTFPIENFYDLKLDNAERTLFHYQRHDNTTRCVVSYFYYQGFRVGEWMWDPFQVDEVYCCVKNETTHKCKPGGYNNNPEICSWEGFGYKFWDDYN